MSTPDPGLNAGEREVVSLIGEEILGIFRHHRLKRTGAAPIRHLSLEAAYQVQAHYIALRIRDGERRIGWKIGCTSRAIQHQFGLSDPIYGQLLHPYLYPSGVHLRIDDYVDCAVESELAFQIGSDLAPGADLRALRRSVAAVCPAIELHNYRFWYGPPSSQELIASNGIHAGLVVGNPIAWVEGACLKNESATSVVNGISVASERCSEAMGGPWESLSWLARELAKRGERVRAGDYVIPGSAVRLVRVHKGDRVEARFTSIGSCHASF